MPSAALISVVVPTYNVAAYLPEFLASLDAQDGGLTDVQFVFCDDGSTDASGALLAAWVAAHPQVDAKLLTKPNGGLCSARNAGLAPASGQWVTFCDPDDVLTPRYFTVVREFLRSERADEANLVAGNLINLDDRTGEADDSHPLRFRFSKRARVVDLEQNPTFIHLHANTGFYRRDVLMESGLLFDERIVPNFEDAHLTALYLARWDRPRIAFLADAAYHYRRRADGSSLVQGGWSKPGKYLNIPRHGWLDLLTRIREQRGRVPLWTQHLVLYDAFYYFRADRRSDSPIAGVPAEWTAQFLDTLAEVLAFVDAETIEDYRLTRVPAETRRALLLAFKGIDTRPRTVYLDRLDRDKHLVRLRYHYVGAAPREQLRARGYDVAPVFAKTRAVRFFGTTLFFERTLWLPADGTLAVTLDGARVPLVVAEPGFRRYTVGATAIWSTLAGEPARGTPAVAPGAGSVLGRLRSDLGRRKRTAGELVARHRETAREPDASGYAGAWLLMDRDDQAQDNAEHLYRYLRREQGQVNAWFVLARTSADWDRLAAEGFRLLAFGSAEHTLALQNCVYLISSQVDAYVVKPLDRETYGEPGWRFIYLRHGVAFIDQSDWLNRKPISLLVSTTPAERGAIIADGSPYVFSAKEVRLTGLARHDRLLELARAAPSAQQRSFLIMPTWRRNLLGERVTGGNLRHRREDFWTSDYATGWRRFLESDELRAAAQELGWRIVFVPHPNMQDYVDTSPLPEHITVSRFRDIDVQRSLVEAGVLITDYSSLATEAAYLERPVVYYQFDQESFLDGDPALRRGAWSFTANGFGPVETDAESAVTAAVRFARAGKAPEPYAARMAEAFPHRDGQCCRRIHAEIMDLTRRPEYEELYLRLDPDADPGHPGG